MTRRTFLKRVMDPTRALIDEALMNLPGAPFIVAMPTKKQPIRLSLGQFAGPVWEEDGDATEAFDEYTSRIYEVLNLFLPENEANECSFDELVRAG